MLIFIKKIGETFVTGSYAAITVLGIKEDQVKLGVDSPADIPARHEVINEYIKTSLGGAKKIFFTLLNNPRKTEEDNNK